MRRARQLIEHSSGNDNITESRRGSPWVGVIHHLAVLQLVPPRPSPTSDIWSGHSRLHPASPPLLGRDSTWTSLFMHYHLLHPPPSPPPRQTTPPKTAPALPRAGPTWTLSAWSWSSERRQLLSVSGLSDATRAWQLDVGSSQGGGTLMEGCSTAAVYLRRWIWSSGGVAWYVQMSSIPNQSAEPALYIPETQILLDRRWGRSPGRRGLRVSVSSNAPVSLKMRLVYGSLCEPVPNAHHRPHVRRLTHGRSPERTTYQPNLGQLGDQDNINLICHNRSLGRGPQPDPRMPLLIGGLL
ncbi:hypothetical protein DPEC_G00286970 [Dallia pectoralis]|uniref:Uncharacterized protein n=1 Tax=Dallia pectoralis TaxID=75939 RepID=A0ACC2FK54_DALPE|nr:hypothetical protein DPEC_G00286970 [Dallia pectoralis]